MNKPTGRTYSELVDALRTTYDLPVETIFDLVLPYSGGDDLNTFEFPNGTAFVTYGTDTTIAGAEGVQAFLCFDDLIDTHELFRRVGALPEQIKAEGFPYGVMDVPDLEAWRRALPIRASYLSGAKHERIQLETTEFNSTHELPLRFFEASQARVPNLFAIQHQRIVEAHRLAIRSERGVLIEATVDGAHLYTLIGFEQPANGWIAEPHLYFTELALTQDEALRKCYAPSLVAHSDGVALGRDYGFTKFNIGMYYPYKRGLNAEVRYMPGLNAPII